MNTLEDMAEFALRRIQYIHKHTTVWSYKAHGVIMALMCYHETWAVAKGRDDDYTTALVKVREEENCGVNWFDTHIRLKLSVDHDPSEAEVTDYVIRQFQRIDERLGIVLPPKYLD